MALTLSVDTLMSGFIAGRDVEMVWDGEVVRGQISSISSIPYEENAVRIRFRLLVSRLPGHEKWKPYGGQRKCAVMRGPFTVDAVTGRIMPSPKGSVSCIHPRKEGISFSR